MAVYERAWRRWDGAVTSRRWRFLVISRFAVAEAFASRLFTLFYGLCALPTLVGLFLIYLSHNAGLLDRLGLTEEFMGGLTLSFFKLLFSWQVVPAFFLAVLVGPGLVSPDLRDNGLPLYLSRPITRVDYVLGKGAVMFALLSPVTWVGGLAVFALQAGLAGRGWLVDNIRLGAAFLIGHLAWIVVISLLSLALSAWLRHKPVAQAALFGLFFVLGAVAQLINGITGTSWGDLLNLPRALTVAVDALFEPSRVAGLPPAAAWLSLIVACGVCAGLLSRKLRAHEVVS